MHTCRARAPHSYAYASNPKTRNAQLETEMLIDPLVNSCREVQRRWSLRTRCAMTGQNSARCACAPSQPCAIAGRAGRAERAGCSLRKVAKVPGTRGGRTRARVRSALYIVATGISTSAGRSRCGHQSVAGEDWSSKEVRWSWRVVVTRSNWRGSCIAKQQERAEFGVRRVSERAGGGRMRGR